jgi:hypothetical protein
MHDAHVVDYPKHAMPETWELPSRNSQPDDMMMCWFGGWRRGFNLL